MTSKGLPIAPAVDGGVLSIRALPITVRGWSAWAPGFESSADWFRWAGAEADAAPSGAGTAASIPMMLRRRTTALGQKMIAAPLACGTVATARYVLASRHGEMTRTVGILQALASGELPSPAEFSMAVHHGLAGLLSIHAGNRLGHTAIAAGPDSFGFGLMEAAASLAENSQEPVILLYGDEPLPGEYAAFREAGESHLPFVLALALEAAPAGPDGEGDQILFQALPQVAGVSPTASAAHDFLRFLLSGSASASSHGERMSWVWHRGV